MTKLVRKNQNSRVGIPRFRNVEQPDAIAYTVRPQIKATQRRRQIDRENREKKDRDREVSRSADQNRAKYIFLKNAPDEVAANYDPNTVIRNQGAITSYDPIDKEIKRNLGLTISPEEVERRVDVANNLNSFYTNLGQPLPTFNKEAVLKDPSRGLGAVNAAIDYGANSPAMMLLQTAPTIGNGSSIASTARGAWNAGSNLFTKTANAAGRLAVRNPGAAATVALTTLPSFSAGNREYDTGTLGLIAAGAFSPEIAKYTYKGLRFMPWLGKFLPKSVTWSNIWNGTKKVASVGNYAVPRLGAMAGAAYLSGKPISEEMSPEEMGEVVSPTSAPVGTSQNTSVDSVPVNGTYLQGRTTLPD